MILLIDVNQSVNIPWVYDAMVRIHDAQLALLTIIIMHMIIIKHPIESTTYCEDGSVRLVNGSSAEAGRLEVCSNNIWGSVCGEGFSTTDAYVICRQIGLGQSGIFTSLAL